MTVSAAPAGATPSSSTGQARWLVDPFTMGSADQFAAVRAAFERIGYTEEKVRDAAKVVSIYELAAIPLADTPIGKPANALAIVAHLFLQGSTVPWPLVDTLIDAESLAAFRALGLLASSARDASLCVAPLAVYPLEGLYIASDHHGPLHDVATGVPADLVYSSFTQEAKRFVELMPRVPCDDYLELCSGTGIAALIAAKTFAKRAVGVDVTERATRFAVFNAMLNGLPNATMLQGDLFAPVAGRTFDAISAHPPYVPSLDDAMVYRDGGDDGERITRRVLSELSTYLRPGGTFFCWCMMSDRRGAPIEARVRALLGDTADEFDVVVVGLGEHDVVGHLTGEANAGAIAKDAAARLVAHFREIGIERFVAAAVLVRRHAAGANDRPVTKRRLGGAATMGSHIDLYARWSSAAARFTPDVVLDSRPSHVNGVEVLSKARLHGDTWTITSTTLSTDQPFGAEAACPSWVPVLLTWCDGTVTVRTHLDRLRELDLVSAKIDDASVAGMLMALADAGFMTLDVSHRE